ncbi:phage tail tape measure protein [Pseudomonas psychrophila]|uniref:phage tail tape measure protein n=1 Tax=Pseudomonas psychrophila TaxID=122355 RepID=UPI0002FBD404|nr:phage tail tape measure protein [Pseudomonas psychrophila]
MAGSLGTLTLDLIAKIGGFTAPMDQAGKAAKKTSREMTDAAKEASQAWSALAGVAAGVVGALSVGSLFGRFITETRNAEQEQAQLGAVLRSTGESAGFNRDQLNSLAGALEKATTFSGGDINQAQTTLLAFTGVVGNQFNRALQSAADMATRTGVTVKAAAETIGRALDVPSQGLTSLSKQGFRFTEEQKKMALAMESTGDVAGAQGIILQALEESYGGAAKAARETFGGSLDALQNTISSLLTGDGSLDTARNAVEALNKTLSSPAAKTAVEALGNAAVVLAAVLAGKLAAATVAASSKFLLLEAQAIAAQAATLRLSGSSAAATAAITTMGVAARGASAAMALLGGPVGVAVAAAAAIGYFMLKSDDAKDSTEALADKVDWLNKSFDGFTKNQARSALQDINSGLIDAQLAAVDAETAVNQFQRLLKEHPDDSRVQEWNQGLITQAGLLDTARQKVEAFFGQIKQLNGILAAPEELPASKVYTEMSKKIQEQILLAGKRTEADKLAARIKAGLVEGLKEGEGELLIADQKRADAAIKAAEATKKADDAAKASAKSAAEALKKRGVDAEENYRRQIELIDETTGKQNKASEVAKLAFELESGKLKGVSADRQKVLKGLAAELDAKIKLQKQNENDIKLAAFSANLKDSNTIVRQGFEMELSGTGSGDRLKERLKADLEIQQDYAKQSSELFKQLNAGDISQKLYDKETEMLSEALAERMVLQQDYYNQLDAAQGNWMDGMGDAWNNYLDQSRDISGQTKTLFTEAFSGMNDALYNFVTTGKLSFSDLTATAASSVLRMLIQWGTAQVAMAALNAFTSTAAIPLVGPLAAPAAAASAMGSAGNFMSMISSVAGMAHDGIDSIPEDGTWYLQKGERVTTAETSAKLDRTLDQVAQKGGAGGNNISIHNYVGAQVETRQEGDQLRVLIKETKRAIAGDLARGNGEITRALTSGYGLRRTPR